MIRTFLAFEILFTNKKLMRLFRNAPNVYIRYTYPFKKVWTKHLYHRTKVISYIGNYTTY